MSTSSVRSREISKARSHGLVTEVPVERQRCDSCERPWTVLSGKTGHLCWSCYVDRRGGNEDGWRRIAWQGEDLAVPAWAERVGCTYPNLLTRLKTMSLAAALSPVKRAKRLVFAECDTCGGDESTGRQACQRDEEGDPICAVCAALPGPTGKVAA